MSPRSCNPARRASTCGRVSTTLLSLAAVVALAGIAVAALLAALGRPEAPSAPQTDLAGVDIRGTVALAPALRERARDAAALFVIARKASGHPFAVVRIPQPRFPAEYRLGPEHVLDGSPFAGELTLVARLSRTGEAGPAQPGDLEGERPGLTPVGTRGADIVLSEAR